MTYIKSKFYSINRKLLFFVMLISTVSLTSIIAYACPALETPCVVSQPSGEKFTATVHGDEWFNYTVAGNGELVVKGNDGYWYYATAANDGMKKSNARFKIDSRPAHAQTVKDVKKLRKIKLSKIQKTYGAASTQKSTSNPSTISTAAVTGTQKVLVLLVSFTNTSIVNTDSAWNNEFFGDSGKTLKTFYKEMSQNNFYFAPAAETKGTANDGVVRVTLNYAHPNTGEDINEKNQNIVINAITAADAYVNFSFFDTNSDGIIVSSELHILTVVAGNDCSYGDSSPCIWPHSWSTDGYIYKDGKNIYGDYTQIAEKQGGHMSTIGVVAHELGHDLGLPDLYDTDDSSDGIGVYSLMAAGSWGKSSGEYEGASPTHMDAWCKIQLGFAAPATVASGSYNLNSVAYGGYAILKIATSDANQYFLVENRQSTGFDAGMAYYGISSGGIAIYHIDMSVTTDNDDETHKLVDLEEANEPAYGGSQLDDNNSKNYAYNNLFRSGTNTLFSNSTTPGSSLYGGSATNISIAVPGVCSGSMAVNINMYTLTFNSNGGTAVAAITQPAGSAIQKPEDPEKTGCMFGGWYYDADLTLPVTWPYTIGSSDICFYACWNTVPVTIDTVSGSSTVINQSDGLIYGLKAGLTTVVFESEYIQINGNGSLVYTPSSGILGTGTEVKLIDNSTGAVIETYRVVIFGDVNGDGNINGIDSGIIVDFDNYLFAWDAATDAPFIIAADVNGDGNINNIDAGIVVNAENYLVNIDQIL